jgi:hypothetical protein
MYRGTKKTRFAATAIFSLVLVLFLMQSREFRAQQGTSHPGAIKVETHKIIPKSGIWFVQFEGDKPFWFGVKSGVLDGLAGISYVVTCDGFSESQTDYHIDLSKVGGRSGHGYMKTLVPLRYTDPNSFVAVLSPGDRDDNVKIKITWKGSFTSADSASGTVSVSCSLCDKPTVTSWTASPGK